MRFLLNKKIVTLFFTLLHFLLLAQNLLPQQISMQNGLASNKVNTVFIDDKNKTWIATDAGIYFYVSGHLFEFNASNTIDILKCTDIKQDVNGDLWFASYGSGIYKYSKGIVTHYSTQEGLIDNKVNKLFIKDDFIYIGTDNGVSIFNKQTTSFISPKVNQFKKYINFSVIDFIEINNEIFFVSLNDGFFKIVNINRIEPRVVKIRNHNYVTSLFLWKDKIYEGSINKINVYTTTDYLQNKNAANHIPISNVKQFTVRGERLVAISEALYNNDGGMYIIRPDYTHREYSLNNDNITKSFTSIAINNLTQKSFVGTKNNGLLIFDIDSNKSFFQSPNSIVTSIKQFNDKVIFIYNNKIEIKNRKDKLLHQLFIDDIYLLLKSETENQRLKFLNVEVFRDTLYLRTNVGIFSLTENLAVIDKISDSDTPIIFHNNQIYPFSIHYNDSGLNSFIGSLFNDNPNRLPHVLYDGVLFKNKIVVSSKNKGLYVIDNDKVSSLFYNKIFEESNINFIQKSKNDKLLVVTYFNGIYELDPENNFKIIKHISTNLINGKNIFFVDTYGLHYVVGTEVGVEFINTNKYHILNSNYGLPYSNYNTGKVIDNTLYIGGLGGYYKFDIQNFLNYNNNVTSISINSIYDKNNVNIYSKELNNANKLVVDPDQIPLVINFIPYTKNDAKTHKVRYKTSSESEWSNYSKNMSVQLLNLSGKNHKIELEFFDETNQTKQQIHLIDIEVKISIWYKILYIFLMLVAVTFLIYIYKLYRRGNENIEQYTELDFNLKNDISYNDVIHNQHHELTQNNQEISLEHKMLLNSLNAHFIFNAFTYLQYNLIKNEVNESIRYNECIAVFFRELIKNGATRTVTIANEISYIKSYIAVEESRFEYEIDFKFDIDEDLDIANIYIPTFILHPILETMLNYSFYDNVKKACVTIKIEDVFEEAIKISYLYNGNAIPIIENDKTNRFNSSLLLFLACLKQYNNDITATYINKTDSNFNTQTTFYLYV